MKTLTERRKELAVAATNCIHKRVKKHGFLMVNNLHQKYPGYAKNVPVWIDVSGDTRIGDDMCIDAPLIVICDIADQLNALK